MVKSTEIYKFEKIKRAKRKAMEQFPDRELLDFGIGENDEMAAENVRRVMAEEINKPENRGYADNGVAEFKDAVVRFMARQFEVHLDPATEVNHCIGSKTALAMLPAVFINPGDVDADDRARLSGRRHAHEILRRRGLPPAPFGRERLLSGLRGDSGRHQETGEAAGHQLSRTARPARQPRRSSSAR